MNVTSIGQIDLPALFPELTPPQADRLRCAGGVLDQLGHPVAWDWHPDHGLAESPTLRDGIDLIVVSATVNLFQTVSDGLDLELVVSREDEWRLTVTATIEVACWCLEDHGVHVVQTVSWLVGTSEVLVDSFETAVRTMLTWVDGSHDPTVWRVRAGLPNPVPE